MMADNEAVRSARQNRDQTDLLNFSFVCNNDHQRLGQPRFVSEKGLTEAEEFYAKPD